MLSSIPLVIGPQATFWAWSSASPSEAAEAVAVLLLPPNSTVTVHSTRWAARVVQSRSATNPSTTSSVTAREREVMSARNLGWGLAVVLGSMNGRLDCAQVERRLWEYLDGALPAKEAAAVRAHLDRCAGCGPVCNCCRAFLALVARTGAAAGPPADLRDRLLARLAAES